MQYLIHDNDTMAVTAIWQANMVDKHWIHVYWLQIGCGNDDGSMYDE